MQRVLAESLVVGRVGEQVAIVGDGAHSHCHEVFALGQLVDVEDDLLRERPDRRVGRTWFTAVDRILRALFGAGVIPVFSVAEGNRDIGLFDVAEHLVVERLLQLGRRLKDGGGIGILGFEVGSDFRIVALSEPGVIVGQDLALNDGFGVVAGGDGRGDHGAGGHHSSGYRRVPAPRVFRQNRANSLI